MVSVEPPETTWPRIEPLPAGADHRAPVDAVVVIEPPVLVGDQHGEIARIDFVRRRGQAPTPVRQGESPQQPAVAIDDDRRALARGGKIDRPEACRVAIPAAGAATPATTRTQRGKDREDRRRSGSSRNRQPFSLAGEGGGRSPTDEGSRRAGARWSPSESGSVVIASIVPFSPLRTMRLHGASPHSADARRAHLPPAGRREPGAVTSPSPPAPRRRCGRSARGCTCPRPSPADRRSGRARRRARHRRD